MPQPIRPLCRLLAIAVLALLPVSLAQATPGPVPAARWDHRAEAQDWTRATLAAVKARETALVNTLPQDIAVFCPAYPVADKTQRAAFWVGLFSALAKHESTWNPRAKGDGGKYRGLLQIAPATARAYGCDSTRLYDGAANLACGVRIAAHQVGQSGLVAGAPGNWGGLALDWGPMRNARKRAEIAAWTRGQSYCNRPARKDGALIHAFDGHSSR